MCSPMLTRVEAYQAMNELDERGILTVVRRPGVVGVNYAADLRTARVLGSNVFYEEGPTFEAAWTALSTVVCGYGVINLDRCQHCPVQTQTQTERVV